MISRNTYLKKEMLNYIENTNEYLYFGMIYSAKVEMKNVVNLFESQFNGLNLVLINIENPHDLLAQIYIEIKAAHDDLDNGTGYFSAIHLNNLSELLKKFQ